MTALYCFLSASVALAVGLVCGYVLGCHASACIESICSMVEGDCEDR